MTMKLTEHHHEITKVLGLYGIRPEIERTNGDHVRFRWKAGERPQKLVTALTPSDHRATRNAVARVRRMLRDAGVCKIEPLRVANPVPQESPPIAPLVHLSVEERLAVLERDVKMLIELLTDPARKERVLAPPPPPPPATKPRRRGGPRGSWLFAFLRYDEFQKTTDIAEASGRTYTAASVQLSIWKQRGYVQHEHGKGWRKHRNAEALNAGNRTAH